MSSDELLLLEKLLLHLGGATGVLEAVDSHPRSR